MELRLFDKEGIDLYIGLTDYEIAKILRDAPLHSGTQKPVTIIRRNKVPDSVDGKILKPYPDLEVLISLGEKILKGVLDLKPIENIELEDNSLEYRGFGVNKIYLYHRKGAE